MSNTVTQTEIQLHSCVCVERMSDCLAVLRRSISKGQVIETLDAEGNVVSIENAVTLRILPGSDRSEAETFSLDTLTSFESQLPEPAFVDLRTVYNCWITRELSITEYISISDERNITNLKFLERTDLIAWLDGSSSISEYIQQDQDSGADESKSTIDYNERMLQDHNSVLHGSKTIDFSSVAKQAHQQIIKPYRQNTSGATNGSSGSNGSQLARKSGSLAGNGSQLRPAKNKDPIILLSPSPSSLINMSNVKAFLQDGTFEPILRSSSSPNLHRIVRNFKHLGSVKFVIVDGVSQFKPEYWERVVAVFVTGQSWQLKQYKWSDPHQLFSNVLGFAVVYKNETIPEQLRQWNVRLEEVDRSQRFKDKEVVEHVWDQIEATMIARGWPVKN